ncbi:PREDICTED: fibulin-1 isoform X1 [Miniopterus natalensis]|uniref:fibulin-1 isoform X1 n=1 Tax=Miniopterus natalensis TaxID=291302 RepID=UPI0007A6F559|nr:PREDICTED: fibulin-1 isoform X1 [Miniopterus natalensis]
MSLPLAKTARSLNAGAAVPIEACCADGHLMATQHRACSLPYASESKECRMVQEQCCHNQLEELHCATGINLANEQDSCTVPQGNASLEAVFVKRCCHCCLLGRVAQARGQSCEYNLMVGYQCGLVFRACCVKGQETTDFAPSDNGDLQETAKVSDMEEEQEDPYLNDRCRGGGPCKQQCRDTGEEVVCSCFVGYQLQPDGVSCEDVNECITGIHNCRLGESCINTVGSFRCQRDSSCGTGYELTDNNDCKDIDECQSGIHNCLPDFICQNTLGSFRCRPKLQCKSGFIQDALGNCIDINECLSVSPSCPVGHTCINTEGSYTCQKNVPNCGRGYHLNEEGTRCVDVDECAPPAEPCGPGHLCLNSPGSFRCECKAGFYFDGISRTCVDINECRRYPGRLCGHKCENTLGSYHCSCSVGFRLAADGRSCEDVNECSSSPCSQECANVYGSYQCYCRRGYQLSDVDGVTCEDIDECALPTGGHICSYRCINFLGSFQCSCPSSGYRLAPNGRNCQDIDECVTGIHNCSINETCFNIQGGFRCLAFECPENYRRSADTPRQEKTDTIRCIKSCRPNDVTCMLDLVHTISHTVVSLPTFREFAHPEEIIFLRAITPAYPDNHADFIFDITEGNLRDSFDIVKRYMDGMTVGVVRQVRPIVGPFHAVLKLEMNYVVRGVVSHRNIVNVHIFVSEYWF